MEVWQRRTGVSSIYLDVKGSLRRGYRITRQVLGPSDEIETNWQLTAAQSRQLRKALDPVAANDSLEPLDAECDYDRLLIDALEALDHRQNPSPFTPGTDCHTHGPR